MQAPSMPGGGLEWVGEEALREALTIEEATAALEDALTTYGFPETPERAHLETQAGVFLTMPAAAAWGAGAKLVTVAPGNPERGLPLIQGVYVLFDGDSSSPQAVFDAGELTAIRTAATSALAAKYLAHERASRLVLFGAGRQARAHLDALRVVRPLEAAVIVDPCTERAEQLVEHARAAGLEASLGDADDVEGADIVCTCTTSAVPLFDGNLLSATAYVNAVGAFQPNLRELDDATMRRARVVVETRRAALLEAGDLLIALERGVITADQIVAELPDVVRAGGLEPEAEDRPIVFESLGHAFEDLVVADAALRAMRALSADVA
ncbi:MAG: ornithine cyclodeaminase family protein [Actinobacteria bacterium]|nr:ornithine cyclodeaminase family protein [Actinomycetota bacterium]